MSDKRKAAPDCHCHACGHDRSGVDVGKALVILEHAFYSDLPDARALKMSVLEAVNALTGRHVEWDEAKHRQGQGRAAGCFEQANAERLACLKSAMTDANSVLIFALSVFGMEDHPTVGFHPLSPDLDNVALASLLRKVAADMDPQSNPAPMSGQQKRKRRRRGY